MKLIRFIGIHLKSQQNTERAVKSINECMCTLDKNGEKKKKQEQRRKKTYTKIEGEIKIQIV